MPAGALFAVPQGRVRQKIEGANTLALLRPFEMNRKTFLLLGFIWRARRGAGLPSGLNQHSGQRRRPTRWDPLGPKAEAQRLRRGFGAPP
jgi:hypothetical protein